jgi:hypothetical protein
VLYHLTGDAGTRVAGERVIVTGTVVAASACGGTGVVIEVAEVEVR